MAMHLNSNWKKESKALSVPSSYVSKQLSRLLPQPYIIIMHYYCPIGKTLCHGADPKKAELSAQIFFCAPHFVDLWMAKADLQK